MKRSTKMKSFQRNINCTGLVLMTCIAWNHRRRRRRCSMKKAVLKSFVIFTGKHLCRSLFLIKLQTYRPATLLNATPTLVFSCEYCVTFKNTYFVKNLRTAAYKIATSNNRLKPLKTWLVNEIIYSAKIISD